MFYFTEIDSILTTLNPGPGKASMSRTLEAEKKNTLIHSLKRSLDHHSDSLTDKIHFEKRSFDQLSDSLKDKYFFIKKHWTSSSDSLKNKIHFEKRSLDQHRPIPLIAKSPSGPRQTTEQITIPQNQSQPPFLHSDKNKSTSDNCMTLTPTEYRRFKVIQRQIALLPEKISPLFCKLSF